MSIGGNVSVSFAREARLKDERGIAVRGETEIVATAVGFLDYQSGRSSHLDYQAKIADTTHLFVCDYDELVASLDESGLSLAVGRASYEVLLIDDPMGMHGHLEIYLRYTGA